MLVSQPGKTPGGLTDEQYQKQLDEEIPVGSKKSERKR
jgi:hypothetical protein